MSPRSPRTHPTQRHPRHRRSPRTTRTLQQRQTKKRPASAQPICPGKNARGRLCSAASTASTSGICAAAPLHTIIIGIFACVTQDPCLPPFHESVSIRFFTKKCPLVSTHVRSCPLLSHSNRPTSRFAKNPCYNACMKANYVYHRTPSRRWANLESTARPCSAPGPSRLCFRTAPTPKNPSKIRPNPTILCENQFFSGMRPTTYNFSAFKCTDFSAPLLATMLHHRIPAPTAVLLDKMRLLRLRLPPATPILCSNQQTFLRPVSFSPAPVSATLRLRAFVVQITDFLN